jgi:peptide subunit release factor RF-3
VAARWPVHDAKTSLALPTTGVMQATDTHGRPVLIFESDWVLRYTTEKNPGVTFRETM